MNASQELIIPTERVERARPYSPPALSAEPSGVMRIVDRMLAQPDFDIAKVQQMVEWYEANEARKAFTADMAEFKKSPPVILKNKHVGYNLKTGGRQDYDHATHDEVTLKIIAAMAPHGFSHRWIPTQPDGNVCVTCVVTHRLGHSESLSITAPPDTSGNKSAVQAILSTKTLLERHTLIAATGLTAADMPDADDREDEESQYLGEGQVANIKALLTETGASEESFLRVIKAEAIHKINVGAYDTCVGILEAKRKHS